MSELLTKKTFWGAAWSSSAKFLGHILAVILTIILARTLLPKDFGLIAIITVVLGLVNLVSELGLASALIQRKELKQSHLSTAFWTSLMFGAILYALALLTAPSIDKFFNLQISHFLKVFSVTFLIGPFAVVHRSLLFREMLFRKVALIDIISEVTYFSVTVSLVLSDFGVWALAAGHISRSVVQVIVSRLLYKWNPTLEFCRDSLRELLTYGSNIVGTNIVNYFISNVDYMIIGKKLGPGPLGHYSLAYNLIVFPLSKIISIFIGVTFPAFSKVQDDDVRFKRGYLKLIRYVSVVSFPMLFGLFIVASEFVILVYGENWTEVILPLRIMVVAGVLKSVVSLVGLVFRAKGKVKLELFWNIVMLILTTSFVLLGVNWSIIGVAIAISILQVISSPIIVNYSNSLIGISLKEYAEALLPATKSSLVMMISLIAYRYLWFQFINLGLELLLVTEIVLGILVYFVFAKKYLGVHYCDLKNLILRRENYVAKN